MQANRLVKIEGLNGLTNLDQLYLADNGIENIENLSENRSLTTLELANNKIKSLDGVDTLVSMEEFWFNDNQVSLKKGSIFDFEFNWQFLTLILLFFQ